MIFTLNKAAEAAGVSKSTLSEAIKSGRLSAPKDEKGRYQIDGSELFRVFPKTTPNEHIEPTPNTQSNSENRFEIERLRAELDAEKRITANMADQVADLRARLDSEAEERRKLTTALLTHTPAESHEAPSGGLWRLFRRKG